MANYLVIRVPDAAPAGSYPEQVDGLIIAGPDVVVDVAEVTVQNDAGTTRPLRAVPTERLEVVEGGHVAQVYEIDPDTG
jgi:hypothetical protein